VALEDRSKNRHSPEIIDKDKALLGAGRVVCEKLRSGGDCFKRLCAQRKALPPYHHGAVLKGPRGKRKGQWSILIQSRQKEH